MPKDSSGKTGTDGKINKLVLMGYTSGIIKTTIPLIIQKSCPKSLKIKTAIIFLTANWHNFFLKYVISTVEI